MPARDDDVRHGDGDIRYDDGDIRHGDGDIRYDDGDIRHGDGDIRYDGGIRHDDGDQAAGMPDGIVVRRASSRDHLGVMRVVDGANLELSAGTAERRIDDGTVVVADDDNRIVGALVAVPRDEGAHVEAIAVRRRRRAQGIGSALVRRAAAAWTPLTAEFDQPMKPFYESLGFDCERHGDRYRGVLGPRTDDEPV